MAEKDADMIFKEFKQHSIAEFFKKNRQMLGYSGKVRSLTTIIHEYVSNSLDACEEAGLLPEIRVEIRELGEDKYSVKVRDNGPGIPKSIVGKAMATVLAGTKFHRYLQQRGQQGIGAASCTLFSLITTNKPVHVISGTGKDSFECDISIDIKNNKPMVTEMKEYDKDFRGFSVYGEFADVKYENSDHGIYEYLKRTALANPHASIYLLEPDGKEVSFPRSVNEMPKRPKEIKPHPLGLTTSDLIDFAHLSDSRKLSAFFSETFSRFGPGKIEEIKRMVKVDFDKEPKNLTWEDAEELVKAFKETKWIAPELDALSTIGQMQIELAMKNILNPQFVSVIERKPKVFRGGIPFAIEVGIAYGGDAGRINKETNQRGGSILRFSNKVPLMFDASNCALTSAVNGVAWKRYDIGKFDEEPITVMINISSVYVPYSGVGKQAVSQEDEIIEEAKLAIMEASRGLQRYISGVRNKNVQQSRYKMIMRYVNQLSDDLSELTGEKKESVENSIKKVIETKYKGLFAESEGGESAALSESGGNEDMHE